MDVEKLLSELTIEEKAALCTGADFSHTKAVERLGILAVDMRDCPHGLRKQSDGGDRLGVGVNLPSVCFPTASAMAVRLLLPDSPDNCTSFNEKLVEIAGMEFGALYRTENVAMQLVFFAAETLNIGRKTRCWRENSARRLCAAFKARERLPV